MEKSPDAFRTISEVAEMLETPAHVLRFWETRFPQIRPVKRAGGRRYYRPADIALLVGIKRLLHQDGLTIRGVQKLLREKGIRHIAALSSGEAALDLPALDQVAGQPDPDEIKADIMPDPDDQPDALPGSDRTGARVVPLGAALAGRQPPQSVPFEAPRPNQRDLFAELAAPDPEDSADLPVPDAPFINVEEGNEDPDLVAPPAPVSRPDFGAGRAGAAAPAAARSDSGTASAAVPASPSVSTAVSASGRSLSALAARLRGLPPGALAGQAPALKPLRERLRQLHQRLAEAHRDQGL